MGCQKAFQLIAYEDIRVFGIYVPMQMAPNLNVNFDDLFVLLLDY